MSEQKKPTPGPWKTVRDNFIFLNGEQFRIVYGKPYDVAYCPPIDEDNGNANAALIVRAVNCHEDLLEACKQLLDLVDGHSWPVEAVWDEARDRARAAIAKAEGRDG